MHHKNEEHAVQLYRNVNIAGTLHLARCAALAGVRQFIFVSAVLVHGRSNEGRAPLQRERRPDAARPLRMSKAAAEAGLRTLARGNDMKISVIRPPLVYGAGAKGNFALLTRAVALGLPLPFAAIRNQRAFLAVQNPASFILHRLGHPDPPAISRSFWWPTGSRSQRRNSSRVWPRRPARPRMFSVPPGVLGTLLGAMGRQDTHDSLIGSLELDISKALATDWQPQVSVDEGLRLALSAQDA